MDTIRLDKQFGAALILFLSALSVHALTFSSTSGSEIPDNSATGVTNIINVSNTSIISSFDSITFTGLSHTWIGDLEATITHNGVTVDLFNRLGASINNSFGDSSNLNGDYTFTETGSSFLNEALLGGDSYNLTPGTYSRSTHWNMAMANNTSFSSFASGSMSGDWTVKMVDHASGDLGSLTGWSFNVTPSVVPEPSSIVTLVGLISSGAFFTRKRRQ